MLVANDATDSRTIPGFVKDHLSALAGLFHRVLGLCLEAGLVRQGQLAVGSIRLRANASKHQAMSYRRRKAKEVDEEEARQYGRDQRGDEALKELSFREGRLGKIREAKAALEAKARAVAEQAFDQNLYLVSD